MQVKSAKKGKSVFLRAVLVCTALLLLTPYLLIRPGLTAQHLEALMTKHADTDASGVSKQVYPALAEAISGYLNGNLPDAQTEVVKYGVSRPAFSENELLHLTDVKDLLFLAKTLFWFGVILLVTSLIVIVSRERVTQMLKSNQPLKALRMGLLMYFLLLVVSGLVVAVNFNEAFFWIHKMLFTNDLWLMDPSRDLMIQLMPAPFFVEFIAKAALRYGLVLLTVLAVLSFAIHYTNNRKDGTHDYKAS